MTNVKKKGNKGENRWANWLNDQGIRAWKDGQSGGGNREKSDVANNIGAHFEVKTVKRISVQEAWSQASRDADMAHSTPHLIIHYDGMPRDSWFVVMSNWDWIELQKAKLDYTPTEDNNSLKWALTALKQAIHRVLKLL